MSAGRPWQSAGLRLAALSGFLVLIAMLAALALVYVQVSALLHASMARQLAQAQQRLAAQYAQEGPEAAARSIAGMLRDGRDTDTELVLLTTPQGAFLAGNLGVDALPEALLRQPAASPGRVVLEGPGIAAQVAVHRLPDGALLVLGYDLRELSGVESMVASASVVAGLFALALALASAWFFRRELGRSVDALHRTITRIAGGQLHERVPVQAQAGDEFARIEQDFNHMLDRIGQLMAGVRHVSDDIAHNLRTPLTRLRLRLQAAHDGAGGVAELRAALDAALHDIDDLGRVLDKLLSIAQAESGTRRAPFAPLAWRDVAAEVAELYEDLAEHEGVALAWEGGPAAPVLGDRALLAGALVNVVDNAIKYAGRGARVRMWTRECAGGSEAVVEDDGPAAPPPEALDTLGRRFVRLRPDLPGHGLGLASVQAVMRLHGGEMRLESAAPGLRVVLRLPLHDGRA